MMSAAPCPKVSPHWTRGFGLPLPDISSAVACPALSLAWPGTMA